MRRTTHVLMLATIAVFVLAGCVRYDATITLHDDNTASGEVILAVAKEAQDRLGATSDQDAFDAVFGDVTFGEAFVMTPYDSGDFTGERYSFDAVPFEELGSFGGLFTVIRDGDSLLVQGIQAPGVDAGDEPVPSAATATLRIEFPGPVTDHNGTLDGTTVSWDLLTQNEPIAATGTVPRDDDLTNALIGGLIAAGAVTVLAVIVLIIHRRRVARAQTDVAQSPRAHPDNNGKDEQ